MHRILKSHLDNFAKNFGLENLDDSKKFEHFVNYCVISQDAADAFDLGDVTTGDGDSGIDGIAIIIDEEVVVSAEDTNKIFEKEKRNHDVKIVFTQAKTSEDFDLGEFLKFSAAVESFASSDSYSSTDECESDAHAIYEVCLNNVSKIRDGKPSVILMYVGTGVYRAPKEIEKARVSVLKTLQKLGYFKNITIKIAGRDDITGLWASAYSSIRTHFPISSNAPFPPIKGIEEAYLVVARASDVVDKVIAAEDGSLRAQVFEENVRSFLGEDNPVNKSIADTLKDSNSCTRFPVMNNGITIVAEDVRVQGSVIHLENYQIVNGCQTSHILFQNRRHLDEKVMVNLKIIEATNEDIFAELVRATNSQSKIDDKQFFSLRPIVRRVEQYFATYEKDDGRLYFERRERQYVGKDVPAVRIFSVNNAAKCVAAMFFNRPDLAYRYPKQMYEDYGERIFDERNREIIFYTACLALYRVLLLTSNAAIPQNTRKMKWHFLPLIRTAIAGDDMPGLGSKKIETYCNKIISKLAKHQTATAPIMKVSQAVGGLGPLTSDRLKRQAVLEEMINRI